VRVNETILQREPGQPVPVRIERGGFLRSDDAEIHSLDPRLDTNEQILSRSSGSSGVAQSSCAGRYAALASRTTLVGTLAWMPEEGLEPPTRGL
jgi:hypothetical protein